MAALLSVVAAMKATGFLERLLWLTAAFLMPVQHAMVGREIHCRPLLLAAVLACLTAVLYAIRREAIVLAALIPFFAIPQSKLVENYPRIESADLRSLSEWARASTSGPALFLFPDSGTSLEPGIFRARSLRGLYVDWKSGGQVNYFPGVRSRMVDTLGRDRQRTLAHDARRLSRANRDGRRLRGPEKTDSRTKRRYSPIAAIRSTLLLLAIPDDAVREIVGDLRLVACDLVISRLQQLILAIDQRLANRLLHFRVGQFALARRLPADDFQNPVAVLRAQNSRRLARSRAPSLSSADPRSPVPATIPE